MSGSRKFRQVWGGGPDKVFISFLSIYLFLAINVFHRGRTDLPRESIGHFGLNSFSRRVPY